MPGFRAFEGGYVGVDVFFVISGYLITGILARQLAGGTFSVAQFYERRARRIVPALAMVCLHCAAMGAWLMTPDQQRVLARTIGAVALFALERHVRGEHAVLRAERRGEPAAAHVERRRRGAVLSAVSAGRADPLAPGGTSWRRVGVRGRRHRLAGGRGDRQPTRTDDDLLPRAHARVVGIVDGSLISTLMVGVPMGHYWRTVWEQIAASGFTFRFIPNDFIHGLVKPFVFGGIISISACYSTPAGARRGWGRVPREPSSCPASWSSS